MKTFHRRAAALLVLVVAATTLLPPLARTGSQTFLEVEGTLVMDSNREGVVLLRIDRMFRLLDGQVRVENGPLVVSCPSESASAMTTVAPGQTLALKWEMVRGPGRGFARRARGGQARLTIPAEGWVVRCGAGVGQRLYGAFVTGQGLASEMLVTGEQGGFWSRIGVTRGHVPGLPKKVRIRLAWSPDIASGAGGGAF